LTVTWHFDISALTKRINNATKWIENWLAGAVINSITVRSNLWCVICKRQHEGTDGEMLVKYQYCIDKKNEHPERCSECARNWKPKDDVELNPGQQTLAA
jgi:hypothetical protein